MGFLPWIPISAWMLDLSSRTVRLDNATEVLPEIAAPMLVLTGTRDIVTLPSASDLIGDGAPAATVVRVQGAGHMGFMERAGAYNEQIAAFADKVFAAQPAAVATPRDARSA